MSIQLTDVQLRKIKEFIEVLGNEKPNYAGMYQYIYDEIYRLPPKRSD
ncbi:MULTISPECIES: hypothetical protein [Acinetobacter]|uniref:Uncharacterized protein n=2 Tax=Acinetobacter haemolyticus TaxID=29430 RepID=D4XLZ8_ACIHA|nr:MULTISPECIES: hypothetical protein [Acinetobacter]EEH69757.1 hypothetical protein HMPREF0023_0664 [Acinetobacter sp. ATCC 27244]EFF83733.1 hypothetical protein HMP0015_0740 [Acinetobacter haemolyticus ATCC 19194]ENW16260.1 hypothetical protein F927_02823 [Acinetobacter haemolyticus CIP 64.3 = MTCC 9819]ENW22745.1 hypothetical protein F926_00152 [Acinetobacter haemolyticus NIPH 261]EPR90584.1 hypothetical protein L313_0873 [Acinetobacter haemolyticus CIP 64.3 = MTCC 9819]